MIRPALSVLLVLALAGCGFHLRQKLALPEDTPPVRVVSKSPFSELVTILERNLRNAGATVAARQDGKPQKGAREARLEILSERWGDLPIAIDERGRAQEYSLRYATIFTFRLADGRELVPRQVVELSRDYISSPNNVTGTSTEREVLADELRREMAASILRRIDSVLRAELARAEAGEVPAPADADGLDPVQGGTDVLEPVQDQAEVPEEVVPPAQPDTPAAEQAPVLEDVPADAPAVP